MNAQSPVSQFATFFQAKEATIIVDAESETSLCDKIKKIVWNAFATIVYFATCSQIDLRDKTLFKYDSILEYMHTNHIGEENKLVFKGKMGDDTRTICAWSGFENGQKALYMHRYEYNKKGEYRNLEVYIFNEAGMIDTIQFGKEREECEIR